MPGNYHPQHTCIFASLILLCFFSLAAQGQIVDTACPLADGSWGRCISMEGYRQENEPELKLQAIVYPARQGRSLTPIYLLAGGPGQAASEAFLPLTEPFNSLANTHDLVILDQRGTGNSAKLHCHAAADSLTLGYKPKARLQAAKHCLEELQSKYDLSIFTSQHAVQDLEKLRQALGHEKIIIYAISYGSRVALQYAKLYEAHIEKMILEGVVSHDYVLLAEPRDFQNALKSVFSACSENSACRSRYGKLQQRYDKIKNALEHGKPVKIYNPYSRQSVEINLSAALFDRALLSFLYQGVSISLIPSIIKQADEGNFQPLLSPLTKRQDLVAVGSYLNIICSEDLPFHSADLQTIDPELREICQLWPRYSIASDFRSSPVINSKTLLLSGGLDPVTPPRYATSLLESMPQAEQLILDNFSHNIHHVRCVQDLIHHFIADRPWQKTDCNRKLANFHFFQHRSPLP